jgi:predicted phosphodiesterase
MIWLIYSDVHGNLPAFETILKDCGRYDASICLGDLVNYGPWSNECVDLALSLKNPVLIMGNHEEAFIDGRYPGKNPLVQQFFDHTRPGFDRLKQIKAFVAGHVIDDFKFQHSVGGHYLYPDTTIELDANYVVGHSHHQFRYKSNGFRLFNAGSVGQNRKIINVGNYALYDQEKKEFSLREVRYDLNAVIGEMRAREFPKNCIDYYLSKQQA